MNKEWFSDYKEQILLNNVKEAKKVLLDNKKNSRGIYSSTIYLCVPSMGNNLTVKVRCGLGSGNH